MKLQVLTGAALDRALDAVAQLRIAVFRDWPYLYDGDLAYERSYLSAYQTNPNAVLVGAFDGDTLVGAATGTPLEDHADDFARAFANTRLPLDEVFYCAESVLLPAYRGQGIGHRFFDLREAHARDLGRTHSVFCAVQRPSNHPLRPDAYRPLDPFWRKRGYAPMQNVTAEFDWKDVDKTASTRKTLQFWHRSL